MTPKLLTARNSCYPVNWPHDAVSNIPVQEIRVLSVLGWETNTLNRTMHLNVSVGLFKEGYVHSPTLCSSRREERGFPADQTDTFGSYLFSGRATYLAVTSVISVKFVVSPV